MEKIKKLQKFDYEKYYADGKASYEKRGQIEEIADKIHERGYSNIFLVGIGGTWAEFYHLKYIFNRYSDLDVYLENAAELIAIGNRKLTKDSIVITSSSSGDTKEIVEATAWMKEKGIEVIAFAKEGSPVAANSTYVINSEAADCEDAYLLFQILGLRLMHKRGEFPKYEKYIDQLKNLHTNLVRIREEADDKLFDIAQKYYKEPYNIFVGSGILWGEVYLFSMCILEEMQWVRTKSVTSADFFHGTLELVEKGVPVFLLKGEDECRKLDTRVENFAQKFTDKLVVIDTAEYALDGIDDEFRVLVSPMITSALLTERLARHYETFTKHNLKYRRYYRQIEY